MNLRNVRETPDDGMPRPAMPRSFAARALLFFVVFPSFLFVGVCFSLKDLGVALLGVARRLPGAFFMLRRGLGRPPLPRVPLRTRFGMSLVYLGDPLRAEVADVAESWRDLFITLGRAWRERNAGV